MNQGRSRMEGRLPDTPRTLRTDRDVLRIMQFPRHFHENDGNNLQRHDMHWKMCHLHG
jgi:hypothetical protein